MRLGPLGVFRSWWHALRAQGRDWPDLTGQWPIPLWIFQMETYLAQVEHEGRAIATQYAKNRPGTPPLQA